MTLMKEAFLRNPLGFAAWLVQELSPYVGVGVAVFFGSFSSAVRRNEL
jgi:hypothetical protein